MKMASVAALLLAAASAAHAQFEIRIIARSGETFPGGDPDVTFDNMMRPVIAADGRVIFASTLEGDVDDDEDEGVWVDEGKGLQTFVLKGEPAPGLGPNVFTDFEQYGFIGDDVMIVARTATSQPSGVWVGPAGDALVPIVLRDQSPPGLPDMVRYDFFGQVSANELGEIAFIATLEGQGVDFDNDGVVVAITQDGPQLLAREEDEAPGTPPKIEFAFLSAPVINEDGLVAFRSGLSQGGGMFRNDAGIVAPLLLTGLSFEVPGMPGVFFDAGIGEARINDADAQSIRVGLTGDGVNDSNDTSIWRWADGAFELLAREGQQVPGFDPGVKFTSFHQIDPVIDHDGRVVFQAGAFGGGFSGLGVWRSSDDGIDLIASEGMEAPGSGGEVFEDIDDISVSRAGEILFCARLEDDREGVWVHTIDDELFLVLIEGQDVMVEPGFVLEITGFQLWLTSGGQDGLPQSISDDGRVAAEITLEDGTEAIIVATGECFADCNEDDALSVLDFVCFQGEWMAQSPKGDCDGDGLYDIFDFICFQDEFTAGCP